MGKTAFLLVSMKIALDPHSYRCPDWVPQASALNQGYSRNLHLRWGTHKRRTKGSIARAQENEVIEMKWSGREDLNLRPPGPEICKENL